MKKVEARRKKHLLNERTLERTFDLPRNGLLIQPLWIPELHHLQTGISKDLNERKPRFLMKTPGPLPVLGKGGDEGGDHHDAGVREELADLRDSPDIFRAVFVGETQVGIKAEADVVTVEAVGDHTWGGRGRESE